MMKTCLSTGLLLISWTALSGCHPLTNDMLNRQIPGQAQAYDSKLNPGSSARALLSSRDFKDLIVEIQAVKGFTPSTQAMNYLQAFLQKTLPSKAGRIQVVLDEPIPSPGGGPYTILDVRDIEQKNRHHYTAWNQVAVYFLFLDGESSDDFGADKMIGQAHQNTSIVIYENTLRQAALANNGHIWNMEAVAMTHEFGHVLGLVNSGANPQSQHEDTGLNAHHCTNPACLMSATIENAAALAQKTDLPQLDEACLADLKAAAK